MARARNIKPGFFTNDQLGELDPFARLLFIGLWTMADRDGRLEDRPKKIKAELLPYDDVDVNHLLDELSRIESIRRYVAEGIACIEVIHFSKHQNPHPNEKSSGIPEYHVKSRKNMSTHVKQPSDRASSLNPSSLKEESGIPHPDTANRDEERKTKPKASYPDDFETFWLAYPSGNGIKSKTYERWRHINPDAELIAEIMAGLDRWKACERWENGYVKSADIWLRDAYWVNEPPPRRVRSINSGRANVETFNGNPVFDSRGNPTTAYFLRQVEQLEAEERKEHATS